MTVTGKTLGENLEELKKNGFYDHCDELLREKGKLLDGRSSVQRSSMPLMMQREQMEHAILKATWLRKAV